jgi:hypothetical protein
MAAPKIVIHRLIKCKDSKAFDSFPFKIQTEIFIGNEGLGEALFSRKVPLGW